MTGFGGVVSFEVNILGVVPCWFAVIMYIWLIIFLDYAD